MHAAARRLAITVRRRIPDDRKALRIGSIAGMLV